jgi:hypothetical protein
MKDMNRRDSARMEVRLKCHVTSPLSWPPRVTGVTENISRSGILMLWQSEEPGASLPRIGEQVTVDIELPANHGFGQKCIHCQATVVRVTPVEKNAARVALNVNYMQFRDYDKSVAEMSPLEEKVGDWTS